MIPAYLLLLLSFFIHCINNKFMNHKFAKPLVNFNSPNLSKLQEVVIDNRTKIYIPMGADAEEAKLKYFKKREATNKFPIPAKKPE